MRQKWITDVLVKSSVNLVWVLAAGLMLLAFIAFAIVGYGGTGALTADPPPDQPSWAAIMLATGLFVLIEWGAWAVRRKLLSAWENFVFG